MIKSVKFFRLASATVLLAAAITASADIKADPFMPLCIQVGIFNDGGYALKYNLIDLAQKQNLCDPDPSWSNTGEYPVFVTRTFLVPINTRVELTAVGGNNVFLTLDKPGTVKCTRTIWNAHCYYEH